MFFESKHSEKQSEFHYHFGDSLDFPLHIHRSFEFFSQLQGKTLVIIDGKEYELKDNIAVMPGVVSRKKQVLPLVEKNI